MKAKIVLLAIMAAAGVLASIAVAKPPPGHGHGHGTTATTATTATTSTGTTATTSTTTTTTGRKVLVCHKVGNGHYVLLRVSVHSSHARGKHGDVPAVNGACPGTTQGHQGAATTTAATTTTIQTTTQTTTTSS